MEKLPAFRGQGAAAAVFPAHAALGQGKAQGFLRLLYQLQGLAVGHLHGCRGTAQRTCLLHLFQQAAGAFSKKFFSIFVKKLDFCHWFHSVSLFHIVRLMENIVACGGEGAIRSPVWEMRHQSGKRETDGRSTAVHFCYSMTGSAFFAAANCATHTKPTSATPTMSVVTPGKISIRPPTQQATRAYHVI